MTGNAFGRRGITVTVNGTETRIAPGAHHCTAAQFRAAADYFRGVADLAEWTHNPFAVDVDRDRTVTVRYTTTSGARREVAFTPSGRVMHPGSVMRF